MGRQAVFHQPHVYARFANRCCRLFGASDCGYLGIAQRHCMHAVDGNVVFSKVAIDYLRKTLRVLDTRRAAARREALRSGMRRIGCDLFEVRTGQDFVAPLVAFFKNRERRALQGR